MGLFCGNTSFDRDAVACAELGGEDAEDAFSCRSLSAKEPHIIELFCGEWPIKIRHPMGVCHLVRHSREEACEYMHDTHILIYVCTTHTHTHICMHNTHTHSYIYARHTHIPIYVCMPHTYSYKYVHGRFDHRATASTMQQQEGCWQIHIWGGYGK